MPLVHWMRHELKDGLLRLLGEPRTLQRGYFNPQSIRAILDEHFRGRRNHAGVLWMLLILELWHRNFLERNRIAGNDPESSAACSGSLPMASQPAQLSDEQRGRSF